MKPTIKRFECVLLALLVMFVASCVQAYDTLLLEIGTVEGDVDAEKLSFHARFTLPYAFREDEQWQLESYLEAGVSYWNGEEGTSEHEELFDFSLTPVVRLQLIQSSQFWPFAEVGFGVHVHTSDGIGDKNFDIPFAFGSHLGVGFRTGTNRNYEFLYRFKHLSNADIGDDNPGINFHSLQFGYHF
jgi:hypothetical protein